MNISRDVSPMLRSTLDLHRFTTFLSVPFTDLYNSIIKGNIFTVQNIS